MKKKIFILLLLGLIVIGYASVGYASAIGRGYIIKGNKVAFNKTTGYPVRVDGVEYFPFVALMQACGANAYWDPYTETAIAIKGDIEIKFHKGKIYKNGALIYNGDYQVRGEPFDSDYAVYLPTYPTLEVFYDIMYNDKYYYLYEKDINKLVTKANLPAKFDLRKVGRIDKVRNQFNTPHCWAFSSTSALASSLLPSERIAFSPEHLANVSGARKIFSSGGGNTDLSTAYYAHRNGPVLESDDPLDGETNYNAIADKWVKEVVELQPKDFAGIKKAIYETGPVVTSIFSPNEYNDTGTKYEQYAYNKKTYSECYLGEESTNHEIILVGWDDNYPKDRFWYEPNNNGAFIAKNSWGDDFGDGGYYYISYEDIHVGDVAVYYKRVEDNPGNKYTYYINGEFGATDYVTTYINEAWYHSWYYFDGTGKITDVGTYCLNTSAEYELYIVENYDGTYKDLNRRRLLQKGVFDHKGYYEIELNEPQRVNDDFAILIKCKTNDEIYKVPVEKAYSRSRAVFDIGNYGGYSADLIEWHDGRDTREGYDVCLRVFVDR